MDTKLKNYKYSVWFKLSAIVLCVAGMLTLAYGLMKAPYFEDAVQNTDFQESIKCKDILWNTYYQMSEIAFTYKSEEYIKSGAIVNDDYARDRKNQIISDRENAIREISNKYNDLIQQRSNNETSITLPFAEDSYSSTSTTLPNGSDKLTNTLVQERDKELQEVLKKYDESIKNIKNDNIKEQLSDYQNKLENLSKLVGVYYTVIEDGKVTQSNIDDNSTVEDFYNNLPVYEQITKSNAHSINFNDYNNYNNYNNYYNVGSSFPNNAIVYLGMSSEKYNSELATFNKNSSEGLFGIKICSIGLLAFLLGLIYIIYSSGRRVDSDGIQLLPIDFVYLDVMLLVTSGAIALCMASIFEFGRYLFANMSLYNSSLILVIFGVIISIGTLIGILFVTMFSKRVKRHEVIKHTLIFKICNWIIRKIKIIYAAFSALINTVFDRSPLAMRLLLIFGAYSLIIMISILLFLAGSIGVLMGFAGIVGVNVVAIYYLLKIFKTFKNIKDGAERIRAGELSYNIPVQGVLELRQLSETINKIADGLNTAVSSQVKAEKMKSELITNVSHDLKTPLTSIITYVDLLKNEGLKSENADKYLGIIDSKSQRLKSLTEDLFEAAKATSGSMTVNIERLDVVALINQGLGELSDKIEASGLSFKTNLQSDKLYVNADGKLLWRVIENLLSNVFKYAMPNSRVYIDASATSEQVSLIIKNISAYELNVNEDELMERFKRGDASRHSEGSGLGLSIAKSLTELQGGRFSIDIDGDLFKATIVLPIF